MNCSDFEDLFSDHFEGHLAAQESARVTSHLEQCDACRANYEAFQYALGDLQSLELRETSRNDVATIMAAVDRAQAKPAGAPRTAMTHLIAAAAGALLVWWFWPETVRIEEKVVEVRVEVPVEVERLVEVPVPVDRPVDRIVERVVDRIVEVPVEVAVQVPVERLIRVEHPLQLRTDRFLAVAGALADLASLAAEAVERPESMAPEVPLAVAREPQPAQRSPRSKSRESSRSPVRVLRTSDRISLQTRGPLTEVVPALISMLSDEDPLLRQVVEEQLVSIRDDAGLPAMALPDTGRTRSPTGLANIRALIHGAPEADEAKSDYSSADLWRDWWKSHGQQLTALESRPTI